MAFVPRVYEQILIDMIAHVRANTTITDFTIGSVIRSILEAAALEDDEQYHQMVELGDSFSFNTATGDDLDRRAADYNLVRLAARPSSDRARYMDGSLTTDFLQYDASAGAVAIYLTDSTDFPTSGFPYDVRIGETTSLVEDVTVSANDTELGKLTVTALVNDHSIEERVSLIDGSVITVPSGILIQVPAQGDDMPIIFQTKESATKSPGNYYTNTFAITSTDNGIKNNVGANKITQFTGGAPFPGALVSNPSNTRGGRDIETDREFRDRIRLRLQNIARATSAAIQGSVKGLEDSDTGERVITAKLVESFTDNEHLLYIDDGTAFVPTEVQMARTTVYGSGGGDLPIGSSQITVVDSSEFPSSGWILISPENVAQVEVFYYTSKNDSANALILNPPELTTRVHNTGDEVLLMDFLGTAELGQNYFQIAQYPVKRASLEIYDDSNGVGAFELKSPDIDYWANRTNGQLEYYGAGLPEGTRVFGNYTYFTGLLALAQKVVSGDPKDIQNYPGIAAGGVVIYVDTPTLKSIAIVMAISVDVGYDEESIKVSVKDVLENYIDGLGLGENVILSRLVERAFTVDGVTNAIIKSPLYDIVVFESEVPKSYDSNGNSLVTVI
jgi:uncharacterized phage protein gp47/JayE